MTARNEFIAKWIFDEKGFVIGTERKEDLIRCKECESHRNRSGICDVWHHHTSGEGFCHRGRRYGQQTESSAKGEPVKD